MGLLQFGQTTTKKPEGQNGTLGAPAMKQAEKIYNAMYPEIQTIKAGEKEDYMKNIETPINGIDYNTMLDKSIAFQKEQWKREDEIRKETQEREDNAIQRKVIDMKKAGINPNLAYSMSGAESGGGITTATGVNTSTLDTVLQNMNQEELKKYELEYQKQLQEMKQMIEQAFEGNENQKDRAQDTLGNLMGIIAVLGAAAFKFL